MTVPAVAASSHRATYGDTLTVPPSKPIEPTSLLEAALDRGLGDKAFRLLTAAAVRLPRAEFLGIERYAEAAGVSVGSAAKVIGELEAAGLVRRHRFRGIRHGKKRDIDLFAVVVRP